LALFRTLDQSPQCSSVGMQSLNARNFDIKESVEGLVPSREQLDFLTSLTERFPVGQNSSVADLVHFRPRRRQPLHNWFSFREGYAPELIHYAISGLGRTPTLVLDPFCGVGTTLLGARQADCPSVGFEINPVLVAVARAKTRNYSSAQLHRLKEQVKQFEGVSEDSPRAPTPDLIFRQNFVAKKRLKSQPKGHSGLYFFLPALLSACSRAKSLWLSYVMEDSFQKPVSFYRR